MSQKSKKNKIKYFHNKSINFFKSIKIITIIKMYPLIKKYPHTKQFRTKQMNFLTIYNEYIMILKYIK